MTSETRLETSEMRGLLGSGGGGVSSRAPFEDVEMSRVVFRNVGCLVTGFGFAGTTTEMLDFFGVRFVPVMYFEAKVAELQVRFARDEEGTLFDRLGHRRRL